MFCSYYYMYECRHTDDKIRITRGFRNITFVHLRVGWSDPKYIHLSIWTKKLLYLSVYFSININLTTTLFIFYGTGMTIIFGSWKSMEGKKKWLNFFFLVLIISWIMPKKSNIIKINKNLNVFKLFNIYMN